MVGTINKHKKCYHLDRSDQIKITIKSLAPKRYLVFNLTNPYPQIDIKWLVNFHCKPFQGSFVQYILRWFLNEFFNGIIYENFYSGGGVSMIEQFEL